MTKKYRYAKDFWGSKKGDEVDLLEDFNFHILLATGIIEEITEEKWKPRFDCSYWFIASDGDVHVEIWDNKDGDVDEKIYDYGNVFRTELLAERARDKIKELLLTLPKE